MPASRASDLEWITEARQARVLLETLRAAILKLAQEPCSATELARHLGLPRQRVNYHVRELSRSGLLKRAGRRRRRNMFEQRYVASGRSYVLSPDLLGAVRPDWRRVGDPGSATYLIALAAQLQVDVADAMRAAQAARQKLTTLSMKLQFRFESAEQRQRFERELNSAVMTVIARWTSPNRRSATEPAPGRAYRLVLGCYPYASEGSPGGGEKKA
jgi:DNA-binding transcriptional ArsR family regulator